jgi:demethylmenaquinone methyltransferase/2-methoxy-6-polyprenyl-1,4-benzoquinol methylase
MHPPVQSLSRPPDLALARLRYREHAAGYDASARRSQRWRLAAIDRLELRPGETVVDVGCGTGLSFPALSAAVGAGGRVVGVEASPDMAEYAQRRIERDGLINTTLRVDSAGAADLPPWDGILLHYVHDVLRDPAALAVLMARARPGARAVAVGMRLPPVWALPLWPWILMRARPYMTTFEGLRQPWSHLATHLDQWSWRPIKLGTGFIGAGRVRPRRA